MAALAALSLTLVGCGGSSDTSSQEPPGLLVVQTATSGNFAHHAGASTLTLHGVYPSVTFFSDRPERTAGQLPNDTFVELWSQPAFQADPPNAALTISGASPSSDVFVLELRDPRLHGQSISYKVTPVSDSGITNLDERRDRFLNAPSSFRNASLLIDDLSLDGLLSGVGHAISSAASIAGDIATGNDVAVMVQAIEALQNQSQQLADSSAQQASSLIQQMTTEANQIENELQQNQGSLSSSEVTQLQQELQQIQAEINAASQAVASSAQGSIEPAQQSTEPAQGGG